MNRLSPEHLQQIGSHHQVCILNSHLTPARVVAEFLIESNLFFSALRNDYEEDSHNIYQYLQRIINYLQSISYNGILPNVGDNDSACVLIPWFNAQAPLKHIFMYSPPDVINLNISQTSQWLYRSKDINDIYIFTRCGKFAYYVEGAYIHMRIMIFYPLF